MTRTTRFILMALGALLFASVGLVSAQTDAEAATAPGKITFLAATCPSSSSMYQRVVAGQDPNSNENGNAADPSDIAAYGCARTSGMGLFLLANSTPGSVFLDEGMQQPATISSTESSVSGASVIRAGSTVYVPGGVAQTRRFSVSDYPVTITSRAAMPFLDLQCVTDGYNSDNADGAGWGDQAIAAGAQTYCIAYVWDGVAASTATPTTPAATPTATPTATTTKATVTVNFPGLSSVHVYAHPSDGAAGTATGAESASSTWKSDSTTMSVNRGTYDIRVVHGPITTVIDNVNCSTDCTVNVPLATLTVNFPGLTSAHSYAHVSDGAPGTYGSEDSSSTWKDNSTTLTLLQGVYDVRVVHGPTTVVLDNIDCRQITCSANVPLATLTVNFPGLTSAHSYAHTTDGAPGTYGAEDSSSTWKDNSTSMVLLQAVYDVRVVHGPTSVVLDNIDCRQAACSVNVPLATLTVNFPGLTSAHSYAHRNDGATGTVGAEDTSSTWKDNSTSMVLLQAVYDVRVVHGPMQSVFDDVDCRAATCQVDVPLATLTVNFPGLTSAHTYAHKTDGSAGSVGAEDSSSTWKDNGTSLVLLQGLYDVRVVHGPMQSVFDNVDCRATTCVVDVPLADLTVNFPGLTSAHTYAHKSDGAAGSWGAEDSSSTWKDNSTTLKLLQAVYDVRVVHGPTTSVIDNVDCRAATCVVDVPLATLSVSFPGHSSVHTYVRANDGAAGTATGAEDSSATWRNNSATFTVLRDVYDVFMQEGSKSYVVDAVDCRAATCSAAMPEAASTATPAATVTPTATPSPTSSAPAGTPSASPSSQTATPGAGGTTPTAAATNPPAADPASVKKTFVKASDTEVTWKLEPSAAADLFVWDFQAESCEAFGGADCGGIVTDDHGTFSAGAKEQYLLVTQSYKKDGESCEVRNTAEFAPDGIQKPLSVDATYVCSGASTMGWGLFVLFAGAAVGMTWVARRKLQWAE